MWSPLLQCTWWLITNKKAMVDYELNLQGWLDEFSLFQNEPTDYGFNFDEILSSEKTNGEPALITGLPDPDWLDAPADISILDFPKSLDIPILETDSLNLDDANNFLLDLIGSNLDASHLFSDVSKKELNQILDADIKVEEQVASPGIANFPIPSPYYESISEASSPASVACSPERLNPDLCLSPGGFSVCSSIDDGGYESISDAASPLAESKLDPGVISVTVCDVVADNKPLPETLSIDEVKKSVRKRKYVSDGKDIPKVQVSLKNVFHPYASSSSKRSGGKNERKKVQNKEAAARYRIKKRVEENLLSNEVSGLEKEQEELKKKHDGLLTEIKYLKNLMREILQKKGVL